MRTIRIIPRLDIKGPNLVKGIHLEGLRVLGKPNEFAKYYYQAEADELIYVDIVASLYGRNSLLSIIEKTAKEVFIPLTVGGGLRTIDDITAVLRAGADKVSINTAAVRNPEFIRQAARKFGSSTIVVSIEAIKQSNGKYLAYTDNGREYTGLDVFEWAVHVFKLGAGEILLTSVDREGTGLGYDIELIRRVAKSVSIPVIACGGAGSPEDIKDVILKGEVDAVAISSMIHYDVVRNKPFDGYFSQEGNIEFLKRKETFSKISPASLQTIKSFLTEKGIPSRFSLKSKVGYV